MSKCNPDVEEWLDSGTGTKTIVLKLNESLTTEKKFEAKLKGFGIEGENDVFGIFPIFVVNADVSIAKKIVELDEVRTVEFPAKKYLC